MASGAREHLPNEPTIENRAARHDYSIGDTLECGIELLGTEVKSVRAGKVSLAEGYVAAAIEPPSLTLHSVHIAEYPPAGKALRREIVKLAEEVKRKGFTIVPLKIYFKNGRAKLLVGLGTGRKAVDKRHAIAEREMKRDIDRAMQRRR